MQVRITNFQSRHSYVSLTNKKSYYLYELCCTQNMHLNACLKTCIWMHVHSRHAFECMFHVQHVCEELYFHVQNSAYTKLYCKKHIIKRSGPKRDPWGTSQCNRETVKEMLADNKQEWMTELINNSIRCSPFRCDYISSEYHIQENFI